MKIFDDFRHVNNKRVYDIWGSFLFCSSILGCLVKFLQTLGIIKLNDTSIILIFILTMLSSTIFFVYTIIKKDFYATRDIYGSGKIIPLYEELGCIEVDNQPVYYKRLYYRHPEGEHKDFITARIEAINSKLLRKAMNKVIRTETYF